MHYCCLKARKNNTIVIGTDGHPAQVRPQLVDAVGDCLGHLGVREIVVRHVLG